MIGQFKFVKLCHISLSQICAIKVGAGLAACLFLLIALATCQWSSQSAKKGETEQGAK